MSITKYASFESSQILDVKGTSTAQRTASLDKLSDYHDYRTEDGYLYARIIAISSRVNKNNDGWPSVELAGGDDAWDAITAGKDRTSSVGTITAGADSKYKYGYSTFVGKPIFVDHNNSDPKRARGVIVDAKIHIDDAKTASEHDPYYGSTEVDTAHLPPTKVELLLEVDAKSFPKLAKAIVEGSKDPDKGIDGFSMGCDVERSVCSHCGHTATNPNEYCSHIVSKGALHEMKVSGKEGQMRRSYENCYGVKFFEISAVFDPADETALLQELIDENPSHEARLNTSFLASRRTADNPLPQSMHTRSPGEVDTLRKEKVCPTCGEIMDGPKCDVCGHEDPPEGFNNPDLSQARGNDLLDTGPRMDEAPNMDQNNLLEEKPPPGSVDGSTYLQSLRRKPQSVSHRTITAGKINTVENPIKTTTKPASNEPQETVISDQTKPVTAAFRTAMDLIQAAQRTGEIMSDQTRVAAEPADSSGKADKRIDVEGVGGVMDASADAASKADKQVDVEGKGGVIDASNAEASEPDEKQSVEETSENAGFDKGKRTQDSGPTRTWTEGGGSAVTDKAFAHVTEAAKQGVKPEGGSDVQPQRREDVEQESGFSNPQNGTDQWTGTGGNGVTRQADPVTRKVDPNIEQPRKSSHIFSAIKLADTEVAVGLTPEEKKYDRIAELEALTPEELAAEERVVARIKTAGLAKSTGYRRTAATTEGLAGRLPSFARHVGSVEEPKTAPVPADVSDSQLFIR